MPPTGTVLGDLGPVVRMPFEGSQEVTVVAGKHTLVLFDATMGQRLSQEFQDDHLPGEEDWEVLSPTGVRVPLLAQGSVSGASLLPGSGTYTLRLAQVGTGGGTIRIVLWEVPPDPVIWPLVDGPAVPVATVKKGQDATAYFDGIASRRVSLLRSQSTSTGVTLLTLYDPAGSIVYDPPGSFENPWKADDHFMEPIPLPFSGRYQIFFDPVGPSLLNEQVNLYDVAADPETPIAIGGEADAIVADPGQKAYLTFSLAAATSVTVTIVTNPFTTLAIGCLRVRILQSDNTEVYNHPLQCAATFAFQTASLPPGPYKVEVNPRYGAVGTARVRVQVSP